MKVELTTDAEFQSLIPPLSNEEFASLKRQIAEQGCLEPLYVWKDGDSRILLDGHNRYKICTENGVRYTFVKVPNVTSREEARLWILEHQAGRRNLTDDQRAVVWNDIRESRSSLVQASKLRKAREAKTSGSISAKTAEIASPKKDTRKEIASKAKLPESKLRQAQSLKKADPKLYEQVRNGDSSLRAARRQLSRTGTQAKSRKDRDYFHRIGRALDGVFKGALKDKLDDLACLSQEEMTPAAKKGLQRIAEVLDEVSEMADGYASRLRAVLQSGEKAV